MLMSSKELLPADSFTYISEACNTASWLDQCISTADAHTIIAMNILYGAVTSDHMPMAILINVKDIPLLSSDSYDNNYGCTIFIGPIKYWPIW